MDGREEEIPYSMKRELLRFLGLKVYVYKTDKRFENIHYEVKVALPRIADLLGISTDPNIAGTETVVNGEQDAAVDPAVTAEWAEGLQEMAAYEPNPG